MAELYEKALARARRKKHIRKSLVDTLDAETTSDLLAELLLLLEEQEEVARKKGPKWAHRKLKPWPPYY
jgi:hypothetical protein